MRKIKFAYSVLLWAVVASGLLFVQSENSWLILLGVLSTALILLGTTLLILKPPWLMRLGRRISGRDFVIATNSEKQRILLVSSNGAGLGHLTRLLSVAQELRKSEFHIYTLSSGHYKLPIPRQSVTYFPSYGTLGMDPTEWEEAFDHSFQSILQTYRPHLVLFDGTSVYRPITRNCRISGIKLVWLQRGCWKEDVDRQSVQRHQADVYVDEVIIPGDYGCKETVDCGKHLQPHYVSPITSVRKSDLLDRNVALSELGLDANLNYVLVQLGAGVINDITDLRRTVVDSLPDGYSAVVTKNPLNQGLVESGAIEIEAYPIARYFNAFKFGVFAAGYNSVQEAVSLGLPAIFIPNSKTGTDDQVRRAMGIQSAGLGLVALDMAELSEALSILADSGRRKAIFAEMLKIDEPIGAEEVARKIE